MSSQQVDIGDYKYGFHYEDKSVFKTRKGLSEDVVRSISEAKNEPEWMLEFRLKSLAAFNAKPMPTWGGDLSDIDFSEIFYYAKPTETGEGRSWDDLPSEIKDTYDRLGIPEAEQKFLGGVGAQYDSEVVYHSIKEDLEKQGVLFLSPEQAVEQYPDIVKKYFGTVIPYNDNKFAALNSAVWSGGSFVYVPKGVQVDVPLQAYFRINSESFGQFERTLIIAEEGSFVHYVEGVPPRFTPPTVSTARSWKLSRLKERGCATRRFRTGPATYTTSSPNVRSPTKTPPSNGWTATSAVSGR